MLQAALFTLVGVGFFAHWVIADPSFEGSATQDDWPHVLGFSAVILALAVAVPTFARLAATKSVFRVSLIAGAGALLSSLANILEDGLKMDWAFYAFISGSGIILVGLLVQSVMVAFGGRRGRRALALIPAGTVAALIFYVHSGGPLMLATWLGAGACTLFLPTTPAT